MRYTHPIFDTNEDFDNDVDVGNRVEVLGGGGMFICPQTARLQLRTFLLHHSSNCLQQEDVIKHMTTMMIMMVQMMTVYPSF